MVEKFTQIHFFYAWGENKKEPAGTGSFSMSSKQVDVFTASRIQ